PVASTSSKRATDVVAYKRKLLDAEIVDQPQLVVGNDAPRVVDQDRAGGFATIGIALVHRDAPELVLELLRGVEHGGRPFGNTRIQAPPGVTSSGKPEPTSW